MDFNGCFHNILGVIISTDELIFFRWVEMLKPPTRLYEGSLTTELDRIVMVPASFWWLNILEMWFSERALEDRHKALPASCNRGDDQRVKLNRCMEKWFHMFSNEIFAGRWFNCLSSESGIHKIGMLTGGYGMVELHFVIPLTVVYVPNDHQTDGQSMTKPSWALDWFIFLPLTYMVVKYIIYIYIMAI